MTALVSGSITGSPSAVGPSSVSATASVNGTSTAPPRWAVQTLNAGPSSTSLPSPTTACAVQPSSVPGAAALAATSAILSITGRWWTEKNSSVSCGASPSSEVSARLRASSAASREFGFVDNADPMRMPFTLSPFRPGRPETGLGHPPQVERRVHLLGCQQAPGDDDLPQRPPCGVGLLRHLGRGVVADQRHERGDDHQGPLQQLVCPRCVSLDPLDTPLGEQPRRSSQGLDREEDVVGHERHHRVELEAAAEAPQRDC